MATVYDYFRAEMGDFDATPSISDNTIDMCLLVGDGELLVLVGETVTDDYVRGLMAALIYLQSKYKDNLTESDTLTQLKVGDVSETYGGNTKVEDINLFKDRLYRILNAKYGLRISGLEKEVDLLYGILYNDIDE